MGLAIQLFRPAGASTVGLDQTYSMVDMETTTHILQFLTRHILQCGVLQKHIIEFLQPDSECMQ